MTDVELDGERVLYDTGTGRLARLDAIGSLIWGCFDGTTSLGKMAADLAGGFEVEAERVLEDVVALALALAAQGFVDV